METSGRFRGRGPMIRPRRRLPPWSTRAHRPRGVHIASYHSPVESSESNSDDSTQPPSHVWETPPANPIPQPQPTREEIDMEATMVPIVNQVQNKRKRGPAKCTEFEKLRKHGKIHLKINDGETAPCCENASMFTTRITWILKHHLDMSYARWSDVPKAEKDELIERVRGDFELDWELDNHRLAVTKQLRKRFNAFHHELHKKYMAYGSHEEALASGTTLVDNLVWVKLCGRWGSDAFKKISAQNRENRKRLITNHTAGHKSFVRILEEKRAERANFVDFYMEVRWSKKMEKFVTPTTEDIHKSMVSKMSKLEPSQRTEEAAATVFREVLGSRLGYARGLGEMVIPETTRVRDRERDQRYLDLVAKHKGDAEMHKAEIDEMKERLNRVLDRQNEMERMMTTFFAEFPSQLTDSLRRSQ
ncbi:hypothetical protein F2P56_015166 [Juglans regia]|uniref:Uncharacterized protein n=1 Tax=Juglans regia TaxID=51240 RepID=A0A833XF74_JUGRE|nr:hypothetical protein F2P56_015166 [Juglans regia]